MKLFAPKLFDGVSILEAKVMTINNGMIESLVDGSQEQADVCLQGLVAPGFIDTQVNGGGARLFNNDPDLQTLARMTAAHARFGTTAMMPTLITDKVETMQYAADAVAEAMANALPSVLGIHFEGPHLSIDKRGIHPDKQIRAITDDELALFFRKDLGKVCVTLAPENVSTDIIKELVEHGVIVSLGHSNADSETTLAAIEAGASGFTHLFNAMSPLQSRAAGVTGAALLSDCYTGLIADLHHVCKHSAQLAIKVKSPNKLMLVTDSMSHIGTNQQALEFAGSTIYKHDDKLTLQDGTLAGSALSMSQALQNTVHELGHSVEDAITMASATPANFLNVQDSKGFLKMGYDADFVCLNSDLSVTNTYVAGLEVYNINKHPLIEDVT